MIDLYLSIYLRIHKVFKIFSLSETEKNDYMSNIFVFSFIGTLNFIGLYSILNRFYDFPALFNLKTGWFFVLIGTVFLVFNTILIYTNIEKIEEIQLKKYRIHWIIFLIITILLQFWYLLYL
jgi:hypothetical protein